MAEIAERCRTFDEDLSALIDGELAEARRAEVVAHLATCSGCSARLEALRAVDRALASLPAPAVAPDLHARLARRVEAERFGAWRRARVRRLSGPALLLPVAAAAALVLYLALRAPRPTGDAVEPAPIAQAPATAEPAPPQLAEVEPAAPRELPTPAPPEPEPAPATRVAEQAQPPPGEAELESLDTEDLGVVLELETIEDLPVIANLELLERLLGEEAG